MSAFASTSAAPAGASTATITETTAILSVDHLSKRFGGVRAVEDVSFDLRPGQVTALVGPNGAGKTTVFNMIAGEIRPTTGRILFDGIDLSPMKAHQRSHLGIGRTFQRARLFGRLSVLENVLVPMFARNVDPETAQSAALEHLEFCGLAAKVHSEARYLSTGQRKRLELARALACQARLLLLDEVMAGVDPVGLDDLAELLRRTAARGLTLFLIEHHMEFVHAMCDRVIVMDNGRVIVEGPPAVALSDSRVVEAYIGPGTVQ